MNYAMSIAMTANTALTIPACHSQGLSVMVRESKVEQETPGSRVARLRREKGITQIELAEKLGVTQSVVSDYERDMLRLNGELIVQLTGILKVSADEILGLEKMTKRETVVKNRRLYRQLQDIDRLPKRDQEALFRTIDAFLSKAS